jgi:hypothetical protein
LDRSDARYCVYCNSTFHRSCIIEHFYRNKYCPVCNKKMSLIFMRYGEPPRPTVRKRAVPEEIRKPKWPQYEKKTEVPVFEIDIPTGPLKRTDKYIPKPKKKTKLPSVSRKMPKKLFAVVLILVIAAAGIYYGRDRFSLSLPSMGVSQEEKEPESPWNVIWTYALEGVSDIAASEYGITVGGRSGLVVLDLDGNVLWQKEGDISDVDMKGSVIAASNRGTIEVYMIQGDELSRYGEGTCTSVSLTELGIMAAGVSEGGIILLDIYGNVLQEYETGPVANVSLSSDATYTAYREGQTVYVLDVLGDIKYAFEDGGSADNQVIVMSSGWVFAQAQNEVFLYDGETMVWNAAAEGCNRAGLAVSEDGIYFAVNAERAVIYNADGQLQFSLPEGSCGGIALPGDDVVVSDASTIYYLRMEEVSEEPSEPSKAPEESKEPEESEGATEPGEYELWFDWYQSFLSKEGSTATYDIEIKEAEESQHMQAEYTIEGKEGDNLIEVITLTIPSIESETSFKRWITPEGNCTKAEMTFDGSTTSLRCSESTIRGIDFRKILKYEGQFEYAGQEEITVGKGTFLCHKLQVSTDIGMLTVWISDDLPPVYIMLQDGDTVVTAELT